MPPAGWKAKIQRSAWATKPAPLVVRRIPNFITALEDVEEIDNDPDWYEIVEILRKALEIPDFSTRTGLKRVHMNFCAIANRLDTIRQKYPHNIRVTGGVVAVYSAMCDDALLYSKLSEKDFIEDVTRLLPHQETRIMALRTIQKISSFGSGLVKTIIVEHHLPNLIDLLVDYSEDRTTCELVVGVLSHCLHPIYVSNGEEDTRLREIASPHLASIIKLVTDAGLRENASAHTIRHIISLTAIVTLQASEAAICSEYVPLRRLLVAGLRGQHWVTRSVCARAIRRFFKSTPRDNNIPFPEEFVTCAKDTEPHLFKIMEKFGLDNCHVQTYSDAKGGCFCAMTEYKQHHDLYRLGTELSKCITHFDFKCYDDARFSFDAAVDLQNPFTLWVDAWPLCAEAIREQGTAEEADQADILDICYLLIKKQECNAAQMASKALKRTSDEDRHAFFCWTLAQHACCRGDYLKSVFAGIECSPENTTTYLRMELLKMAIITATNEGLNSLRSYSPTDSHCWEEGVALLHSAFKHSKAFIEEAPPDHVDRRSMISRYIILSFLVLGPEMSRDMKELRNALDALAEADDFARAMKLPDSENYLRLTNELIMDLYNESLPVADHTIAKFEASARIPTFDSPEKLQENLIGWLDHNRSRRNDSGVEEKYSIKLNQADDSVYMYMCLYCKNPSAVLRKCGGCSKARYCDETCQKADWREHKLSCKSRSPSNLIAA